MIHESIFILATLVCMYHYIYLDIGIVYIRLKGKTCSAFITESHKSFSNAVNSCDMNSDCNYILDEKCDGKEIFYLCRTIRDSKIGSCAYHKGIP